MIEQPASWRNDFVAGAVVCVIGSAALAAGLFYRVGTLRKMGPGFFPLSLGTILFGIGVVLCLGAWRRRGSDRIWSNTQMEAPDFRGWGLIVLGVGAFLVLGNTIGLFPAAFACVFISALGDRTTRFRTAAILATFIALPGALLFVYVLGIQMPFLSGFQP